MKIYLALTLLSSLLLTSCSVDWNDAKEKKIGELEKQVMEMKKDKEDDLFKKKQECVKYKDEMLGFAKKYHSEIYELEEIFYSPVKKSCYFIGKEGVGGRLLFDYFSQSYIHGYSEPMACYDITDIKLKDNCYSQLARAQEKYEKLLKELKGE